MNSVSIARLRAQIQILDLQAGLFSEEDHPRFPSGTILDGENVGGQFKPKIPENVSDFLDKMGDTIPAPPDPREFNISLPTPEAFKNRVGGAMENIGDAIAEVSSEAAKGVKAIGDRLQEVSIANVGKFLATEAYAFSKAVVLETVGEPINAAFALAAGSFSMAAFGMSMAPGVARDIAGIVATVPFAGLLMGGHSLGVASIATVSIVGTLGAVAGAIALWKIIDILNRYAAERDIFRASWQMAKMNNEQLAALLGEGGQVPREQYVEEMTQLAEKLIAGLEKAGAEERAEYMRSSFRLQGLDV